MCFLLEIGLVQARYLKIASDHHFSRCNHVARCFTLGEGYLGPDHHSGKLLLWFVGRSVDG